MPSAVKRRKVGVNSQHAASSRSLATFTKVSKANVPLSTKALGQVTTVVPAELRTTRKRKFVEDSPDDDNNQSKIAPAPTLADILGKQSPQPIHMPHANPHTESSETPTKGVRSVLDRFQIASTPTPSPLGQQAHTESSLDLPAELVDLIDLHAALLTTLSIHYAQNGTSSPADLRSICPNAARVWGKRTVNATDIRRLLGVLNDTKEKSRLTLADYGQSKICIELAPSAGRALQPINEDSMNTIFSTALIKRWEEREDVNMNILTFIATLPLEHVRISNHDEDTSPLLAKGRRRLQALKQAAVKKPDPPKAATLHPDGTKMTLLDRLRLKQAQQSKLPPPPSTAERARAAALGKIEEVAALVGVLSTGSAVGQQRVSFTMSTVLEKLRDSFKSPISRAEGQACVALLAGEIAPAWVQIKRVGKSEMVVVDREQRVREGEIRERVERASGR